jgi:YD repeat-containing protein
MTSGKFYYPTREVEIPGRGRLTGNNIRFARAYNNQDAFSSGVLPVGWTTNLDISLMATGSTRTVRDADGVLIIMAPGTFIVQSAGVTNGAGTGVTGSPPPPVTATGWKEGARTLRLLSGGTYEFTKNQGTRYYFTTTGALSSIKDANGNAVTYTRNSAGLVEAMTDSSGQSLTFTYLSGKLRTVYDPQLARTWTFTINTAGKLESVLDPLNRTESYAYNDPYDPWNITTLTDVMGEHTTYTYDPTDRVSRVDYPNASHELFTYNDTLRKSTYQDRDGHLWQYTYQDPGVVTELISPLNLRRSYTYDPVSKRMTSTVSWKAMGDPASARSASWNYSATGSMLTSSKTGGSVLTYQRSAASGGGPGGALYTGPKPTGRLDAAGYLTTWLRDVNGNVVKTTDRKGRFWEYGYRPDGFRTSHKDRCGMFRYWEYDTHGNLTKYTDRTGRITRYEHDAAGRRTKVVDVNNQADVFTYDAGDRLTDSDVATVIQPNPAVPVFTVTAVLQHQHWDLDAANHIITFTDATGRATHYTYYPGGRLHTVTDHAGHLTSYTWTPGDRQETVTDPELKVTTYTYDADGRLTHITEPPPAVGQASVVTSFAYWDNNGIKSLTDSAGRTTTFYSNYAARTRTTDFPDGSQEVTTRDLRGAVSTFTNRAGQTRNYTYDEVGNKTSQSCPTCSAYFYYDVEDHMIRAFDAAQGTYGWQYDHEGRLTVSHQPDGSTCSTAAPNPVPATYGLRVGYSYDPAGRRQTLTYPDGSVLTYDYTTKGQLHHIYEGASTSGPTYTFAYDDAGRRDKITYPSGHYTQWSYDTAGHLETVGSYTSGGAVVARDRLLLDNAGNIVGDEIDNGLTGGRTFGNDALDRLVTVTTSTYGGGSAGRRYCQKLWIERSAGGRMVR